MIFFPTGSLFFLLLFKSKLLSCELLVVIGWGIGFPDWFLASSLKLVPLCVFWFQSGFVSWILFLNCFSLGPPPGVQDLESNEKGNLALASYHLTGQQVTWIRYFVKVQRRQKASKQIGATALRAIQNPHQTTIYMKSAKANLTKFTQMLQTGGNGRAATITSLWPLQPGNQKTDPIR